MVDSGRGSIYARLGSAEFFFNLFNVTLVQKIIIELLI